MEMQRGGLELEVIERESAAQRESTMWRGDEGTRGESDEGGTGIAGLNFEAMPKSGGDLAEFTFGSEVEVEENEGEITIA